MPTASEMSHSNRCESLSDADVGQPCLLLNRGQRLNFASFSLHSQSRAKRVPVARFFLLGHSHSLCCSRAFMRCADEGGLGGTVEIAHRKCHTFLSTFCQLNYIKHGLSPTQCAVTTPGVGHSPQAGPRVHESVVSIELRSFESVLFCALGVAGVLETSSIGKKPRPGHTERSPGQVAVLSRGLFCRPFWGVSFGVLFLACSGPESVIFLHSGRGWRFRDELHWGEMPAWPRPHRETTGAGGCAVARLLLSSFFGESLLAHFSQHALVPKVPLFRGFRAWLAL